MAEFKWNHQYADLPDLRIHYVRHGAGMPIILQHGWPEFWYAFHKNIPELSQNFDIIVPDLRGFGDTDKPGGNPTIEDYVADLEAFANHLNLDQFGIVTHDVGPWIVQPFARQNPDRLIGIFFFDCPYPGVGDRFYASDHIKEVWYQTFHQMPFAADLVGSSWDNCRAYFAYFLARWAHNPHIFDDDLDVWANNYMKPGNLQGGFDWYTAAQEMRMRFVQGEVSDFSPITVPTCVRWGEHDQIIKPDWRDRMDEFFTDIDVGLVEGVGHFPHYEAPDRANAEIIKFFKGLSV
jgi:pimeloyl-ACP methyl ester carboxylesterase